jgi:hypothetical protein
MLDPFPPPPAWLQELVTPWAEYLRLYTLPYHVHEVIFAFAFYQLIHSYVSPWLSTILFPRHYPQLPKRTRLNWDIHVVSFVQSVLINVVALWVMFADEERNRMNIDERVHGYTGADGLVQALATGYFIYDIIVSTLYIKLFGIGMLFHAISALCVFSLGFRPFVNYYAPTFILYELSSPFLNIHWFLDKVNMTGSNLQWYNGMMLLVAFFSCRLVWGTWQSVVVYGDMWHAIKQSRSLTHSPFLDGVTTNAPIFKLSEAGALCADESCLRANAEISQFAHHFTDVSLPQWLPIAYVIANLILNSLNFYWFSQMIDAVLKRFRQKPAEKKETGLLPPKEPAYVLNAAEKLEKELGYFETGNGADLAIPTATGVETAEMGNSLKQRKLVVT